MNVVDIFLSYFALSICVSCFAIVWSRKLTTAGNILYFLRKFSRETLTKLAFKIWPTQEEKNFERVDYLMKPAFECEMCVAGQSALWYYVFFFEHFTINGAVFFVSVTIFITNLLLRAWRD